MDTILIALCLLTISMKAICPPLVVPMALVIIMLVTLKSIDVSNYL